MNEQTVNIVGPNLWDQSKGQFHVHDADCADLKRNRNMSTAIRDGLGWVLDVESREDVVLAIYGDMLDEGSMTNVEDGFMDIHFAPCVKVK